MSTSIWRRSVAWFRSGDTLRADASFRGSGRSSSKGWVRALSPLLVGAGALLSPGCAADRDINDLLVPQDVGVVVVDAVLTVGQSFPKIRLTRTGSPSAEYDVTDVLTGTDVASVVIYKDGDPAAKYGFDSISTFWTTADGHVEPETEYELVVVTRAAEEVRATTFTPPSFSIRDWVILDDAGETVLDTLTTYGSVENPDEVYSRNRLVYATGLLEARFERPDVPAFEVALFSLDLDSDYVIDPDFFDPEDFEDLDRIGSSPPFEGENGTLRLPWFAIFFEGRYSIKVYSMDQNWYDLARSAPGFGDGGPGFGGQAGDDFERPIFHVEGGIGLFGSAAVDSIGFTILPRP